MYQELLRRARETGEVRRLPLRGGAQVAVHVEGGAVITLTISRSKKPLGAAEIETFKRECNVPATAIRFPLEGQGIKEHGGMSWHYIAYRWREEAEDTATA